MKSFELWSQVLYKPFHNAYLITDFSDKACQDKKKRLHRFDFNMFEWKNLSQFILFPNGALPVIPTMVCYSSLFELNGNSKNKSALSFFIRLNERACNKVVSIDLF